MIQPATKALTILSQENIPEQKIPGKPISDMDPPGQGAPEGDQSAERQREASGKG